MGLLSTALDATGLVLLTHAVYSAYEHSLLTHNPRVVSSTNPASTSLPLDITLETLISLLLLCVGIVLGSPALRPIEWSVWAAEVDKEEKLSLEERKARTERGELIGNPFRGLEDRMGFWDVKGKRKEFSDWIRGGGGDATTTKRA